MITMLGMVTVVGGIEDAAGTSEDGSRVYARLVVV
jgi:hypothetical protein